MWTSAPILEAVSRYLSCRSLENSTSWCQQVWIERFRSVQCINCGRRNTRPLIHNVPRRTAAVRRVKVCGGIDNFVRASVEAHEPSSLRQCCEVSQLPPLGRLSGILRLKGVSTSGRAFSTLALPAPRGTDIGSSSTDSSTTASCARKRRNSHSEYKATISGGCTVGEITDPAVIDLACLPYLSHVWEAMILIEKHTLRMVQSPAATQLASGHLQFSSSLSKAASGSVCNKHFFKAAICSSIMARIATWFFTNSFGADARLHRSRRVNPAVQPQHLVAVFMQ